LAPWQELRRVEAQEAEWQRKRLGEQEEQLGELEGRLREAEAEAEQVRPA